MKWIHLSDLHLGKRLGELSLREDQQYILSRILDIAEREKPDGVIIAGDVYDKPVPSAEAVEAFDGFVVSLAERTKGVYVISGNHDSSSRLAFGNRLMQSGRVWFSSVFNGRLEKIETADEYGPLNLWMLPFIKPVHVRAFYEDVDREDYTAAVRRVIEESGVNPEERNILIAHQYVTGAERSDSEDRVIGGLENVDASAFAEFDYVALGHLHKAQTAGDERIRYCGAPLKYSFAEAGDARLVLLGELKEKGDLRVETVPLKPLREMAVLEGTFDELMSPAEEIPGDRNDFVKANLRDEEYIPDAIRQLRKVYPNILELTYPRIAGASGQAAEAAEEDTPMEYVEAFYRMMRGRGMNEGQEKLVEQFIGEIWEEEE